MSSHTLTKGQLRQRVRVEQEDKGWKSHKKRSFRIHLGMKGANREGYRVCEGTLKKGDIFEKLRAYLY